jgi:hypothetical protein
MKIIKDVLEKVYSTPSLRQTIIPLFVGNPGIGKSATIYEFAKEKKANIVEFIVSQMSPFEISGIAMADKESNRMKYYDFDRLLSLKDGDILFLDELLNGNPVVMNACLTLLQQRITISGKPLPDIMIVAAANFQGQTPITPQIKERFVWYTLNVDEKEWSEYLMNKYNVTNVMCESFLKLIKEEKFDVNNFNTPRSIDKAIDMIINDCPTPYNHIKTILNTMIENPFDSQVKLSDERVLEPNEMINWLDLIRIKKGVVLETVEKIKDDEAKDFIIPEHWYIVVDHDNFNIINEYYKDKVNSKWVKNEGYALSDNTSYGNYWSNKSSNIPKKYKEISLEEFKKYILNK